jgi:hypothetical protein
MSAIYFSMRASSNPASMRSWEADEGAGPALDGGFESGKIASRLRRHEQECLLGLVGHGNEGALLADLAVPGLDAGEPLVWWRVRCAAQEDADEQVLHGLRGGQVGMQPEAVAGLQVGHGGDGQRLGIAVGVDAGDADIDPGADEVEAGVPGAGRTAQADQKQRQKEKAGALGHRIHGVSLDGS